MNFPSFKYIVVIYFILGFHALFVYPKIVLAEIPKNFPPTLFIIEPVFLVSCYVKVDNDVKVFKMIKQVNSCAKGGVIEKGINRLCGWDVIFISC